MIILIYTCVNSAVQRMCEYLTVEHMRGKSTTSSSSSSSDNIYTRVIINYNHRESDDATENDVTH